MILGFVGAPGLVWGIRVWGFGFRVYGLGFGALGMELLVIVGR